MKSFNAYYRRIHICVYSSPPPIPFKVTLIEKKSGGEEWCLQCGSAKPWRLSMCIIEWKGKFFVHKVAFIGDIYLSRTNDYSNGAQIVGLAFASGWSMWKADENWNSFDHVSQRCTDDCIDRRMIFIIHSDLFHSSILITQKIDRKDGDSLLFWYEILMLLLMIPNERFLSFVFFYQMFIALN